MRDDSLTESIEILARHLVIDLQRIPAHRPIRLPLQLAMAAGDGRLEVFAGRRIAPLDDALVGVHAGQRNLHDDAGDGVDRQERRIGGGALLAQARQHDRLHRLEVAQHVQQRRVEAAGAVIFGRGGEFVIEAEAVEEAAQHRVVVGGEAVVLPERVGHLGQRLAEIGQHQLAIGDVVGRLAQPVHVVGEGQ